MLLWAGFDSVISVIGLNPGRVEKTEWRAYSILLSLRQAPAAVAAAGGHLSAQFAAP